jgi:TPR repeat protein
MPRGIRTGDAVEAWREGCELEERGLIPEALRAYTVAARLGSSSAQVNLGNILDDVVKPSRTSEAKAWYKRAVKRGNPSGAWNLAMHYRNNGNPRWYRYWLRVAADLGDEDAANEMRNCAT